MKTTAEFYGGPWDGEIRNPPARSGEPIAVVVRRSDGTVCLAGEYHQGSTGWRDTLEGKWNPVPYHWHPA